MNEERKEGTAMDQPIKDTMSAVEVLDVIVGLSHSQGFYGRLYETYMEMKRDDPEAYAQALADLEAEKFTDVLQIVRYFEEGIHNARKFWRVPVVFEMYGYVEVEAASAADAYHEVRDYPELFMLPADANYVEDSFKPASDDEENCIALIEEASPGAPEMQVQAFVVFQSKDRDGEILYEGEAEFDARKVLDGYDDETMRLIAHGDPEDLDQVYEDAARKGLVKKHEGPFEVDLDEDGLEAYMRLRGLAEDEGPEEDEAASGRHTGLTVKATVTFRRWEGDVARFNGEAEFDACDALDSMDDEEIAQVERGEPSALEEVYEAAVRLGQIHDYDGPIEVELDEDHLSDYLEERRKGQ